MGYDSVRERVVVFGGLPADSRESNPSRVWEWDGSQWTLQPAIGPNGTLFQSFASDTRRGRIVLVTPQSVQTWEYGLLSTGDFDLDGDVDLADFAGFAQCFAGAGPPPSESCPPGVDADFDDDGDVDLADYARFAQSFTGSR
jgi:hypothetical protein